MGKSQNPCKTTFLTQCSRTNPEKNAPYHFLVAAHESTQSHLLTVNDAAAYLNVERSTLYRLIRDGELVPTLRVGHRWRFRIEQLDAYAERDSP